MLGRATRPPFLFHRRSRGYLSAYQTFRALHLVRHGQNQAGEEWKARCTEHYARKAADHIIQLEEEIKFRGLAYIAGEGKHPVGDWPGEPSYLVFDLSLEAAKTLGRKFNQNAIVWCDLDAVPQLILLR